ncbi:MAG: hypothetical protein Q8R35_01490 [bacterium]|nr:hypothetical protein [bacterium]
MNPIGIFVLLIALTAGYYVFTAADFLPVSFFSGFGSGPIASGPGSGSEVENPQPIARGFFGFGGTPAPGQTEEPPLPRPGESPYKGRVSIAGVNRSGVSPEEEYVTIRYGGGFWGFNRPAGSDLPIDVTGWRISSRRTIETVPRAFNIPEIDAQDQDVILPSGGEVIIFSGTPGYQKNFRENRCAGYLNEFYSFTPTLSNSCPDATLNRSQLLNRGFSGACIDAVDAIATCRLPAGPFQAGVIGQGCIDYMNQNFSYAGCVKNYRDRGDFLGNTWRVALRRITKMYDPLHDRVTLRDAQGLLVDEFEY